MKSIIICEGITDLVLIQYFMEKANNWEYTDSEVKISYFEYTKNLIKENRNLSIASTGGCSKIVKGLEGVIDKNMYSTSINDVFNNIVIITDNDDEDTLDNFKKNIKNSLIERSIYYEEEAINNNSWINIKCLNGRCIEINFRILLLIVPFKENGAMETFLLNAIGKDDEYDNNIIQKSNDFISSVDEEKRYLKKRRHLTKAKFEVYFCIRTPLEQFGERGNILRNVEWEKYKEIQNCFEKLSEL